jgi:hypothetical protein
MRVGRADHDGIGLAGHVEVVGEPALAGQQPLILLAADRLADPAERHRRNVDRVVHFPPRNIAFSRAASECTRAIARDEASCRRSITEK